MHYDATIGTYSDHGSDGIYSADVTVGDAASIDQNSVTTHRENPTFLATHPDEPLLYAVHEIKNGRVSSYRVGDDGTLMRCNQKPSGGAGPCYCHVHSSGEYVFVAQYDGGAVSMLPIRADGSLGEPTDVVEHEGSGPNPDRQEGPHPHAAVCGPNGTFLYVPDLGADEVVIYEIDLEAGTLVYTDVVEAEPGTGPRHLDFHPSRPLAYLITELASTIVAYEWDEMTGELTELGTISTLPKNFERTNQTSEIAVHPSGEWVYGANRGHDSIAISSIQSDGRLELVETVPTGGAWPRYFSIDPASEVLFVQNRESNNIIPFWIDPADGTLTQAAGKLDVPAPSCMVFHT